MVARRMRVSYKGTIKEGRLELDGPIALTSGTRVEVHLEPAAVPRKGSAQALLQIAGRLPVDEANAILAAAQECRRVDTGMWTSES
jgi:hypothetical protein